MAEETSEDSNESLFFSPQEKFRKGFVDPSKICGVCLQTENVTFDHPFIVAGLCKNCRDVLLTALYSKDVSGKYVYCSICVREFSSDESSVEFAFCCRSDCKRLFCNECIESLSGKPLDVRTRRYSRQTKWKCFLCRDGSKIYGALKFRRNYKLKILQLHEPSPTLSTRALSWKPEPLRVLSLFDGIGTGYLVLKQLNINVELYAASEVLPEAILVAKARLGEPVCHVGSVGEVTQHFLKEIAPIHLLMGGSPCNDLSGINRRPKDFYDPEGTAKFFFDFYRVKRLLEDLNGGQHLLWLFENVATMPRYFKNTISRFLQSDPVVLNASYFSAQNRARYFWGNIPGLRTKLDPSCLANPDPLGKSLLAGSGRTATVGKVKTVTTQYNSLLQGRPSSSKKTFVEKYLYPVEVKINSVKPKGASRESDEVRTETTEVDVLWLPEIEDVFGFPRHYTDVGNLSRRQRQTLLGHSWPVQLIEHILKPLKEYTVQA